MITSGIMKILDESIQIYDKLCGKNYLIVFGSKNKYKFIQTTIRQSSFWHLLGCSLELDTEPLVQYYFEKYCNIFCAIY